MSAARDERTRTLLRRGLCGATVAAALLPAKVVISWREDGFLPDSEYQAFLDHFPVSKHYIDNHHNDSWTWTHRKAMTQARLIRLFDWRVRVRGLPEDPTMYDDRRGDDPKTVISGVDAVLHVILAARGWPTARADRRLVLMGMSGLTMGALGETEEVRQAFINEIHRLFSAVYTIGNDAAHKGFRTMPLGLVESKVRKSNANGPGAWRAVSAIASAGIDGARKPLLLFAAFGPNTESIDTHSGPLFYTWTAEGKTNSSHEILRYSQMDFYGAMPLWLPRRSHQAGQVPKSISRLMAHRWIESHAARELQVTTRTVPQSLWWMELSRHRFLLSPMGDEIQAPKNAEALLVLTVPILQRGIYTVADDLVNMGFPVAIVDEWEEIRPANLSSWWEELSPRLVSFRANCLTTDAFWRIATGEITSCH